MSARRRSVRAGRREAMVLIHSFVDPDGCVNHKTFEGRNDGGVDYSMFELDKGMHSKEV
jgi:hypothetical protein